MDTDKQDELWGAFGKPVAPGELADRSLAVSERYTGAKVLTPVRLQRAPEPGPIVAIIAAIHGDELNGTGMVRQLMVEPLELQRGGLVMLPVANVLGMESHSRYLPDRRDLNRSFPGSARGSLASRLAHKLLSSVIRHCDYAIDLHTATGGRTNFPHVRADLGDDGAKSIAFAFGCEVVIDHRGHAKTLRSVATRAGIPTIVHEAGEALKSEPWVVELGVRGIRNVAARLGMVDDEPRRPAYQTAATKTTWLRAKRGGFLRLDVGPGAIVDKGERIGAIDNLLSGEETVLRAPVGGVVVGLRTLPAVKPGDPVCNIAVPARELAAIRADIAREPGNLHRVVQASQEDDVILATPPNSNGEPS